ncbi:LysE family translocator [Polaribacter atrinae]|uniref:LysE family translocator n=1 Tax=Polaribacter atrinae TaxID=1333662 RepID=UPI000AA7A905|nr:LysE family transporter [Polaribacter atrinae]
MNKSIAQGRKSSIRSPLGINAGGLIHTFLGTLGLYLLISKSYFAFDMIKYVGFFKLKNNKVVMDFEDENKPQKKGKSDFWVGFFTNTLN